MDIMEAVQNKDSLKLEFFKHVFDKCEQVHVLHVPVTRFDEDVNHFTGPRTDEVEGVMALINHSLLSKLSLVSITKDVLLIEQPGVNSDALTVSIDLDEDYYMEIMKILQTNSSILKRDLQVCARIDVCNSHDLSPLIQKHTKELHVVSVQVAC